VSEQRTTPNLYADTVREGESLRDTEGGEGWNDLEGGESWKDLEGGKSLRP